MNRFLSTVLGAACLALTAEAADAGFSQTLRAADVAAAGLNKLTPQELARLDALVREYKASGVTAAGPAPRGSNAVRAAPRPASPSRVASAGATVRVADDAQVPATVQVAPGTKVKYAEVESRIAGEFRGWEGRTVFTLENGQRWQTDGASSYVTPPIQGPAVKIVPGMLGSFWMTIEGVRPRVKVAPVGGR